MKKKKNQQPQESRNFVAKYMHEMGNCGLRIVEDKKAKSKRGEGKNSFNKASLRKDSSEASARSSLA